MSERLVSKIKVRNNSRGTWVMKFTTHTSIRKYSNYGSSYILDTNQEDYVVPCASWGEAMKRAGYVLINLGAKK